MIPFKSALRSNLANESKKIKIKKLWSFSKLAQF